MSVNAFLNHAQLAFAWDVSQAAVIKANYKKNNCEKAGDAVLVPLKTIPTTAFGLAQRVYHWTDKQLHDPKVLTVGLTATAMTAVTFAFYPERSYNATLRLCEGAKDVAMTIATFVSEHILEKIPEGTFKFIAYCTTEVGILSFGVRTFGRFTNQALMDAFYAKNLEQKNADRPL